MATKNCVKISYKGLTRLITCDVQFQYDELLKTIVDKFNIPNSHKMAIEFFDEQGHKYNKDTFAYFLLLFPNPQKLFFIRLDSSKIINLFNIEETRPVLYNEPMPFSKSKLNNRQTTKPGPHAYCEAVPVRRQNCFLGVFPASTITIRQQQQFSSLRTSYGRNHSQKLSLEVVKKIKQLKKNLPKKKHLNNRNMFKRSMRI